MKKTTEKLKKSIDKTVSTKKLSKPKNVPITLNIPQKEVENFKRMAKEARDNQLNEFNRKYGIEIAINNIIKQRDLLGDEIDKLRKKQSENI